LCELQPLELGNYVNLATVTAALGDESAAEAVLKMAITIAPEAAAAYTMLAQFHLQSGRKPQHARWYAQEAVRRQPSAQGFLLLAATCRMLGDEAGARSAMAEATRLQQANPPAD
jgi:Tfp pilus assembly protein PilF